MKKLVAAILFSVTLIIAPVFATGNTTESHSAVILMYHRFGEDRYPATNIKVDQFEQQMHYLKDNDFKVLPLDDIVHALANGLPLPEKSVAITIDDAYRSVYEIAYPQLVKLDFPFTVFIATGDVDKQLPAFMSWAQVKEMHDNGVQFANHTVGHEHLLFRLEGETLSKWQQRITGTITDAQNRLTEVLGDAPPLFAYPYGEYSDEVRKIVKDLGLTAFGQHSGAAGPLSDMLALPRYPMAERFAGMESFKVKVNSLPLPVKNASPSDPVVSDNPPVFEIALAPGPYRDDQLTCYFENKELKTTRLDEQGRFRLQAPNALPPGRSRYNCTAPSKDGNRYYWFSQPWIVLKNHPGN